MTPRGLLYAALGALGLAAAIAVPVMVYRAGSTALPTWAAAANPGPLSAAHDFLGAQCESCHTPNRGVAAVACLTCHATAAPELLTKASTKFHASIGECAGCHVEHRGGTRPIDMDHSVLFDVGHSRAAEAAALDPTARQPGFQHILAELRRLLEDSAVAVAGAPLGRRTLPVGDAATLDCNGCHATRDPHQTLFGRECQGCHATAAWTVAPYRHPSARSQDCVQCHQAPPSHYMMHFEMMDRTIAGQASARVEQCFLCHQTDAFNNIRGVGWRKMH